MRYRALIGWSTILSPIRSQIESRPSFDLLLLQILQVRNFKILERSGFKLGNLKQTKDKESKVRLVYFSLKLTNCKYNFYVASYNLPTYYCSFQIFFSFPRGGCCEIFMQLQISRHVLKVSKEEEYTLDNISFEIKGVK